MGDINQQWSANSTILSYRTDVNTVTAFTSVVSLGNNGFDGAQVQITTDPNNTTDNLGVYVYSCLSATTSELADPYEQEIFSQSFDAGPGTTRYHTIAVRNLKFFFVGLISSAGNTKWHSGVSVSTWRWNS